MLDAVTLAVSTAAALTALALLWCYSGRRFPALVPVAVVGLLVLTVGLSPTRRMGHIPEVQPVAKAKQKTAQTGERVAPPVRFPADPLAQREFVRLWYTVAEEIGAPPTSTAKPVPASVSSGTRTLPRWE